MTQWNSLLLVRVVYCVQGVLLMLEVESAGQVKHCKKRNTIDSMNFEKCVSR